jgi:hypothetical protein
MSIESTVNLRLEHVFDVRLEFHERHVWGPVSGGAQQGYVSVKTGIVEGPRLNGKVVDYSGADWGTVRTDGVVELNAHYLLQADDGALIYIKNQGYVYGTTPGTDGAPPRPGYFRCTPYFRAPVGPHDWLNRTVIIGGGERKSNPDHSVFRYYAVL